MNKRRKGDRTEELLAHLAKLYVDGNDFTGHYAWRWEEERYHELLVCALVSSGAQPSTARSAIDILKQLHLDGGATLCEGDAETTAQILSIFARLGLDERAALKCLQQVAQVCVKQWDGMPQVFLRKMGEEAVGALTTHLSAAGMKSSTAHTIAVLWLQNVCNVPLLASNSPSVQTFCREIAIDHTDLVRAADCVGLNVAIIDELIALRDEAREHSGATRSSKRSTKKMAKSNRT